MNVAVKASIEDLPRRSFTAEDIRRMNEAGILTEDERFELIEGDLVMMAAKSIGHENIKHALNLAFAKVAPAGIYVAIESTIKLAENILVEPDLTVISRSVYAQDPRGFATPRPEDVLLLIEIAASRFSYDRGVKARLYARHGIREFWVVDANEPITFVHTGPQEEGWSSIVERGAQEALTTSTLPGFSIELPSIS
jgi:Uma2 family endonuclease